VAQAATIIRVAAGSRNIALYCCFLLVLPNAIYKTWHTLTKQPIDTHSLPAITLDALGTFGVLVGVPLLVIDVIKSRRQPDALIPATRATTVALCCLPLIVPLILLKAWHRITGQPIVIMSTPTVILGALGMFGFGLLCVEVIRSARHR